MIRKHLLSTLYVLSPVDNREEYGGNTVTVLISLKCLQSSVWGTRNTWDSSKQQSQAWRQRKCSVNVCQVVQRYTTFRRKSNVRVCSAPARTRIVSSVWWGDHYLKRPFKMGGRGEHSMEYPKEGIQKKTLEIMTYPE